MIPEAPLREVFQGLALRDQLDDLRRAALRPAPRLAPGQVSADGAAIVGKDGWLFLHGGSNQWADQAAGRLSLTPAGLAQWRRLLLHRLEWLGTRGIRYAHLFVPEKSCVYPELQAEPVPPSPLRPVQQIMGLGLPGLHYPVQALRRGKCLAPTYYRSNSHFTAWGAYIACAELWAQLGLSATNDELPPLVQHPVQHDLAVKFEGLPDENWHELDTSALLAFTNEAQVPGHTGRIKQLHNPAAPNACRVLIFGDSYAYDHNLAGWFAQQCREVVCVWQVGLQQALIEQLKPQIVVSQMAERFATRLPGDVLAAAQATPA